jgi:hypothetical protein
MSALEYNFNHSGFSVFLNRPVGRVFRIVMGIGFILIGYLFHTHILGMVSIAWGIFPLSAGAFDICYVSAALGGPISGKRIREMQKST